MTPIPNENQTLDEQIYKFGLTYPAETETKGQEILEKVGHRSYLYQNHIINTIYIRLKNRRKKTQEMLEDLNFYRKWNRNYFRVKERAEAEEYGYLSLKQIEFWLPLAEEYQLNPITRGIKKSRSQPTDYSFLEAYRKVRGNPRKLCYQTIQSEDPESLDWYKFRQQHLDNYLSTYTRDDPLILYHSPDHQGYPNLPTPEHLHLILHGYSPDAKALKLFKKTKQS
jgi:hypothetical protein